jgi:hypothetical protein
VAPRRKCWFFFPELWKAGFGDSDTTGFIAGQAAMARRPFLQVVAVVHRSQQEAVCVPDFVTFGTGLFDAPWRR